MVGPRTTWHIFSQRLFPKERFLNTPDLQELFLEGGTSEACFFYGGYINTLSSLSLFNHTLRLSCVLRTQAAPPTMQALRGCSLLYALFLALYSIFGNSSPPPSQSLLSKFTSFVAPYDNCKLKARYPLRVKVATQNLKRGTMKHNPPKIIIMFFYLN